MNKIFFILLAVLSCTARDKDDPIKNTRRVVTAGHKSLYENGAFEVKGTSIKLIPSFDEAEIIVAGKRFGLAKKAFSDNLKRARESVYILKEGREISLKAGEKISKEGTEIAKALQSSATDEGIYIISKSAASGYGLIGTSFKSGKDSHDSVIEESVILKEKMNKFADSLSESDFPAPDRPEFSERAKEYKKEFKDGVDSFVIGYVDMGDYFAKTLEDSKRNLSEGGSAREKLSELNDFISGMNSSLTSDLKEVFITYGDDTKKEFSNSRQEIEKIADGEGIGFALSKAFFWATKGIVYDAGVKPFVKIGAVAVGYTAVNSIWPVAIVGGAGMKVAKVLVEVVKVGASGVVYLVAPSAKFALAGLLGSAKFIAGESYNGADVSLRKGANAALYTSSKAVQTTAVVTEKAGTYVLAPISFAGTAVGQNIVGGGVALGGTAAGGTIAVTTGIASGTVYTGAKAADYTVSIAGTVGSGAVAAGYGVYYLGKGAGLFTGVHLGSGVVLSYEAIAQMSAHTLLAVSDVSYLVLSMEGGKWVVYGIKDTTGKAKTLLSGAVVDVDQIRKEGGEVYKVPATDEEIERMLDKSKHK